jgi:hypothetical protein
VSPSVQAAKATQLELEERSCSVACTRKRLDESLDEAVPAASMKCEKRLRATEDIFASMRLD